MVSFGGAETPPYYAAIVNDSMAVRLPDVMETGWLIFRGRDFGANDKLVLCGGGGA